jgi:hypothetical protein
MEVMTNWLKPFNAPPAVKAPAAPAKQEFDKKLAAFKKAHGFRERYTMLCYCSRFGRQFEVVFERAIAEERFCIAAVNKLAEQASAAGRSAPSAQKRFDIREFNTAGWDCPYCRAASWITCHCGTNNCEHQFAATGRRQHKCEPGCGSVGEVVPMQEFTATAANGAPKAASSRPALSGATRPGLPPSNFPRLPGKR